MNNYQRLRRNLIIISNLVWAIKNTEHTINCARSSFIQCHKILQNQNINTRPGMMFWNTLTRYDLSYGCHELRANP